MRSLLLVMATFVAGMMLALPANAGNSKADYRTTNAKIIRYVFQQYGDQAVRVARCESGLSVYAHNGQYLGLFQMGSFARAKYGHSNNPWQQSLAAYRYFMDAGHNWSPWSCKP